MSYEHKIHSFESNSTEIAAKRFTGGITLVPQLSDDRADPLNWTLSKKVITLFIFSFASWIGIAQALANQSGIPLQAKVYAKTPIQISYSVSMENQHFISPSVNL